MQFFLLPLLAGIGVIALYVIFTYNKLASLKTQIQASLQEIGNQLKRQASLIPNLEASAKGFLKHEKGIFETLSKARQSLVEAAKGDVEAIDEAQRYIANALPKLSIVVESNPEIQSADIVRDLMSELRDTADKLTYARRTYIDLIQDYNEMLAVFPSNLIAQVGNFKSLEGFKTPDAGEHLEVSESDTHTPKISL